MTFIYHLRLSDIVGSILAERSKGVIGPTVVRLPVGPAKVVGAMPSLWMRWPKPVSPVASACIHVARPCGKPQPRAGREVRRASLA